MRTAVLAALFVVIAPQLHAQARRRPSLIQAQNVGAGVDLSDPAMGASAPADASSGASALAHGNPIAVSQLRIPSKARKEFERSEKAFQAGDLRASADHLEKAVQIYPDFVQAHNVLGTRYAGLGKYDDSLSEYERALTIDPHSGETYHNFAIVLFSLGRLDESEQAARRALELLPQEIATKYVLGCILIKQNKITPEAVKLLNESEGQFPNATLVLAQAAFKQGHTDDAVAKLRAYLSAPQAENKPKVECWIAQLTHEPASACAAAGSTPDPH